MSVKKYIAQVRNDHESYARPTRTTLILLAILAVLDVVALCYIYCR